MKQLKAIRVFRRCFILFFIGSLFLIAPSLTVNGQVNPEHPPRPITVTVSLVQNLSFGAFYHGNAGGSVIVYPDGSRSATGDVVLLSMGTAYSTGLYDVFGNPGTVVSISNGPNALLTNGGASMTLIIGTSIPSSTFIITTSPTQVRIGGTLIVGTPLNNPPGNYSGSFDVTFVQE